MKKDFRFQNLEKLIDGELELVLTERHAADPVKKYVPEYCFEMRKSSKSTRIGEIRLRIGRTHYLITCAGQVSYGVDKRYRGHQYAVRSLKLLLPLAQVHGLKSLWITCDPKNAASRRTCELAGAEYVETVRIPKGTEMYERGRRFVRRYRINLSKVLSNRQPR